MVVDDITKPGFMQPPSSVPRIGRRTSRITVTRPLTIAWICWSRPRTTTSNPKLLSRQVSDDWIIRDSLPCRRWRGSAVAGNYGISRMPSGYWGIALLSASLASVQPSTHFKLSCDCLAEDIDGSMIDEYPVTDSGIALLWNIPWDGTEAPAKIALTEMDPYAVGVCRRVRRTWPC